MNTNCIKGVLKTALFLFVTMWMAVPSVSAVETIYNQEGNLHVVGCEEWISLRSIPSVMEGEVLARIPLGQLVHHIDDYDNPEFAHVSYKGI